MEVARWCGLPYHSRRWLRMNPTHNLGWSLEEGGGRAASEFVGEWQDDFFANDVCGLEAVSRQCLLLTQKLGQVGDSG